MIVIQATRWLDHGKVVVGHYVGLKPKLLVLPPTGTGSILVLFPLELLSTLPGLVIVLLDSGLLEGSEVS